MPTLDSSGTEIYYEIHGEGPTLLLSHGFSATSKMWRHQVEYFARDYRVIVWDFRGHGRTQSPNDPTAYSEKATVADMALLLDHAEAESAIVGGLSLGGYMSLAFYRTHPERTRALMMFDTGPGFKNDSAREKWNRTALRLADSLERDGLPALYGLSREIVIEDHESAQGIAHAARGMLTQRDASVIESLPEIAVPSLVLVGDKDKPYLDATKYMAAKIPGATKAVVSDAGHASNIDQPAEFNRIVSKFLAEAVI